jgi:uncharacterized protein (TIGR00645 family)
VIKIPSKPSESETVEEKKNLKDLPAKEQMDKINKGEEKAEDNDLHHILHRIEDYIERFLYWSRWIVAPMYILLAAVLLIILIKFGFDIIDIIKSICTSHTEFLITQILDLLDLTLIANLVLIVAFSGYENFISRIDHIRNKKVTDEEGNEILEPKKELELPWMGSLDFSGLKLKIIGSVVAISVIELLKDFLNATALDPSVEYWRIILHIVFVGTGVIFAAMEILESKKNATDAQTELMKKELETLDKL